MPRTRPAFVALAAMAFLAPRVAADAGPFAAFHLPETWQARFWSEPAAAALLDLDAKAVAALVPEQAGLKHCRCPKCGAAEADDPLAWSIARPDRLACRRCAAVLPDEAISAKPGGKVPEEVVEVLPRRFHRYPYHAMDPEKAIYADERVYLAAKRDYEAREYLAKAALYAAVKGRDAPPAAKDPRLARFASVVILRFAQVYPAYATHHDRPGVPKFFDRADLGPPYRRLYGTAKWNSSGALDVPLNLAIAYAILRDDPALGEAGRALGDADPRRTIERDLLRASAEFVRNQPEESSEASLAAYRGMLAVACLLDDGPLRKEATARVEGFLGRGFYHDGLWRQGDDAAHRRVLAQLDGWIGGLLADDEPLPPPDRPEAALRAGLPLYREARRALWVRPEAEAPEIQLASLPADAPQADARRPALLGGAGIARLGVGRGDDALDLELRGLGDYGGTPSGRLALRLAVGGVPVLGDLGGEGSNGWGFEHASASKSGLVIVDGLNQREAIEALRDPAPGSDIQFFAADADFQVARFADRFAYPKSSRLYRHTVLASAGATSRYAVSIVEIEGGLQHDQVFHAATEGGTWALSVAAEPGPGSLLPPSMPFVAGAKARDGRWFVQAMGGFRDLDRADVAAPVQATLAAGERPGVRLHWLGDAPIALFAGRSEGESAEGRAALVLRRRSPDGAALSTAFVTLFEPLGRMPGLRRVGRVQGPPGAVVIAVEMAEGTESLAVNARPGEVIEVPLPDGRLLRTDGLAARVGPSGLALAGGTFAEVGDQRVELAAITGRVVASGRSDRPGAVGVFRVSESLPEPARLAGRNLLIRHGDGSSRGWTIAEAENLEEGGARLHVREAAGLRIDPVSGAAKYESFPGTTVPGPHRFGIPRIGR